MKRTLLAQELRKMRFEQAYEGWTEGRLSQHEAAQLLGVCERYRSRYQGWSVKHFHTWYRRGRPGRPCVGARQAP